MLRTKYYLTDAKSTSPTAVYAACYLGGKRKKIYTPFVVLPKQWDAVGKCFRKSFANSSDANALLKLLTEELDACFLRFASKGKVITVDDLKEVIARVVSNTVPTQVTFEDHLNNWIEACKRDVAPATIKGYVTFRNHLLAFGKSKRYRLDFTTLDVAFSESFKNYLLTVIGLTNTSVNNVMKNLKVFLNATYEQELHEQLHHKRFKKLEKLEPPAVYLTKQEKRAIEVLNLEFLPRLERTRDIFLFGCETGLRFSDIYALRPEHVHDGYLIITTQKTRDLLKVPLSPLASSILKKYKGGQTKALPAKTNQKTNADLKLISKLAKLESPTVTFKLRGKLKEKTVQPKWELICTHTARRTFVTLALEGKMRSEVVRSITGHKDHRTLQRYLTITDSVTQEEFEEYVQRQEALAS